MQLTGRARLSVTAGILIGLMTIPGCSSGSEWEKTDSLKIVKSTDKSTDDGAVTDVRWEGRIVEKDACVGVESEGAATKVAVFYAGAEPVQSAEGDERGVRISADGVVIEVGKDYDGGYIPIPAADLEKYENGSLCAEALGADEGFFIWSAESIS